MKLCVSLRTMMASALPHRSPLSCCTPFAALAITMLIFSVILVTSTPGAAALRDGEMRGWMIGNEDIERPQLPPHCAFEDAYPKQYIAYMTDAPPVIDGSLEDDAWKGVAWTDSFVDIFDRPKPRFETRVKMRWDADWLYIAAELEEPQIWANITRHNEVIYQDNDFEVFVCADGSNHYYKEFEVNVNNATWDLCLNKPYIDNGYENSTRVLGDGGWEMQPPLRSAVGIRGPGCRVNDPTTSHLCKGWTVELAMPLAHLAFNTTAAVPPVPGQSFWRINFSRVEYHVTATGGRFSKADLPSDPDNWVWSPQGAVNMHLPERWGVLQFAAGPLNGTDVLPYPDWTIRHVAMSLYDAQREFHDVAGVYASRVADLEPFAAPGTLDASCTGRIRIWLSDGSQKYMAEVQSSATDAATMGAAPRVACIQDDRFLRVVVARSPSIAGREEGEMIGCFREWTSDLRRHQHQARPAMSSSGVDEAIDDELSGDSMHKGPSVVVMS